LSSNKPARRFQDIVENANKVAQYTSGLDLDSFERDQMRYDAVERCLERICEAAARLGDLAGERIPDQPWAKVRVLGDRLWHEYDSIQRDQLWSFIHKDLPSLAAACDDALRNLSQPADNQPL
jgi:uncharacterized protein with HEPN domain